MTAAHAKLRTWLATAKPNWTYPMARPEVEALLAERDALAAVAIAATRGLNADELSAMASAALAQSESA